MLSSKPYTKIRHSVVYTTLWDSPCARCRLLVPLAVGKLGNGLMVAPQRRSHNGQNKGRLAEACPSGVPCSVSLKGCGWLLAEVTIVVGVGVKVGWCAWPRETSSPRSALLAVPIGGKRQAMFTHKILMDGSGLDRVAFQVELVIMAMLLAPLKPDCNADTDLKATYSKKRCVLESCKYSTCSKCNKHVSAIIHQQVWHYSTVFRHFPHHSGL